MDNFRLNNFILWCKNWYQPIDNRMDMIFLAVITGIALIVLIVQYIQWNSEEEATEFLNNFKDLIEQAGDLI